MPIKPSDAFDLLVNQDIRFFAGVPDSLLKSFCSYIDDHVGNDNHVITANEGSSIAISIGYHLATGKTPFVYMQNSGLGNAINPILSLADDEVYSIPLVMMIGWRGEPGVKDEPQHVKQGKVTQSMLKAMRIETYELDANSSIDVLKNACLSATKNSKPVAVLVKKYLQIIRERPMSISLLRCLEKMPSKSLQKKLINLITRLFLQLA